MSQYQEGNLPFVSISSLPHTNALPIDIISQTVPTLPEHLYLIDGSDIRIHPDLAKSFNRVVSTDFSKAYWHLCNERDVEDTVHWCAMGGSFLADFAMDTAKPRIFAWGLNPNPIASHYAVLELKGRDAEAIPTSACTPAEHIADFINQDKMPVTGEQVLDFTKLGPSGIQVAANDRVPDSFVKDAIVQFIVPGTGSPYELLVRKFMEVTGEKLMGITSGNFSSKGKYHDLNGGTHKNLDEIQTNMGFLGIPILAGPINGTVAADHPLPEAYKQLHNRFLFLKKEEKEESPDLLPTSVTIVSPDTERRVWHVVRHGSLHHSVVQKQLEKYGTTVVVDDCERLDIGIYKQMVTKKK